MPPFLDVSEVLLDPMIADRFIVNRRVQTLDSHGRVALTSTAMNGVGVVTASSGNDLDRLDDNQRMGRHLTIVTKFRLRGPSPGYQPDTITWKGDTFVVQAIDPYPQYGAGFVQAIAGSMDLLDQPVPEPG